MQAGDFISSVEVILKVRLARGGAHFVELWLGMEGSVHDQKEPFRRRAYPILQLLVVEVAQTRCPHKGVVDQGYARHPSGRQARVKEWKRWKHINNNGTSQTAKMSLTAQSTDILQRNYPNHQTTTQNCEF